MYPRIHWELDAKPLGSGEHTLGTNGLGISGNNFEEDSLMRTSLEVRILVCLYWDTSRFLI
jgi:hypothetical protein